MTLGSGEHEDQVILVREKRDHIQFLPHREIRRSHEIDIDASIGHGLRDSILKQIPYAAGFISTDPPARMDRFFRNKHACTKQSFNVRRNRPIMRLVFQIKSPNLKTVHSYLSENLVYFVAHARSSRTPTYLTLNP